MRLADPAGPRAPLPFSGEPSSTLFLSAQGRGIALPLPHFTDEVDETLKESHKKRAVQPGAGGACL